MSSQADKEQRRRLRDLAALAYISRDEVGAVMLKHLAGHLRAFE